MYIYIYIYHIQSKASSVGERKGVIYLYIYFPYVHTHKPIVILQSNDGNTLLLLLQRQWASRLKIRNFLAAGSLQSCISNQENQLGLESALLLDPQGFLGAQSLEKVRFWAFLKPSKLHLDRPRLCFKICS